MKRLMRTTCALTGAFLVGFAVSRAGDKDIRFSDLPEMVRQSVERLFPGGDIDWAKEEEEDDEHIYKVRLHRQPDGRDAVLEVAKDGEVLEIDQDIGESEIPEAVRRAVEKAFPRSRVTHAEKETEMDIKYRVDIEKGDKKRRLNITRRGRILEIEKKR